MEQIDFHVDTIHGEFSYRAASLIINNNMILVAKHVDHPCYYTVGGRVKLNETSAEAVVREVREETGFTLDINKLVFVQERFFENCGQSHHEIVFFYLMKYTDDINILDGTYTDQGEKETLHWLPVDKLEHINIVPNFLKTNVTKINENIIHIISKE
jgi:8-oxo-dGTP pyrophosphatase MutT (NUDIX family)